MMLTLKSTVKKGFKNAKNNIHINTLTPHFQYVNKSGEVVLVQKSDVNLFDT